MACVYIVQAVDDSVDPVTSCVHLYGAVYVRETLRVVDRVKKDDGMVSCIHLLIAKNVNFY